MNMYKTHIFCSWNFIALRQTVWRWHSFKNFRWIYRIGAQIFLTCTYHYHDLHNFKYLYSNFLALFRKSRVCSISCIYRLDYYLLLCHHSPNPLHSKRSLFPPPSLSRSHLLFIFWDFLSQKLDCKIRSSRKFPRGKSKEKLDFLVSPGYYRNKNKVIGESAAKPKNLHTGSVFSRVLRDSTTRFVGPSVGPSVHPSVRWSVTLYFFWVFAVFGLTAPAQMMERP